jgi:hypothetical protein
LTFRRKDTTLREKKVRLSGFKVFFVKHIEMSSRR